VADHSATISGIGAYLAETCPAASWLYRRAPVRARTTAAARWPAACRR